MHSQQTIDLTAAKFLLPARNKCTPSSMGYQKQKSQTAFSSLLFQDVMVQLTFSHPILPTSSNLQLTISHHTLRTQNILSISFKYFHHSQPIHSWLQLMSLPYTQTSRMMIAYHPSFISWRNTSISYPEPIHLPIQFTQSLISFLNIAPSISRTHTSTKSLAPLQEQGWLPSLHIFSLAKRNVPLPYHSLS